MEIELRCRKNSTGLVHYTGQALFVGGSLGDAVHINDYFAADAGLGVEVVTAHVTVRGS